MKSEYFNSEAQMRMTTIFSSELQRYFKDKLRKEYNFTQTFSIKTFTCTESTVEKLAKHSLFTEKYRLDNTQSDENERTTT